MQRLRLGLELAEPVARRRRLQDCDALGDRFGVPPPASLLGRRHQAAVGGGPGAAPRVVQQHQCEQPGHLGVLDRGRELPGEADRFGGEVYVAGTSLVTLYSNLSSFMAVVSFDRRLISNNRDCVRRLVTGRSGSS